MTKTTARTLLTAILLAASSLAYADDTKEI